MRCRLQQLQQQPARLGAAGPRALPVCGACPHPSLVNSVAVMRRAVASVPPARRTRRLLLLFNYVLPAAAVLIATAAAAASEKRGFVADGCAGGGCEDRTLLSAASWYYDYNPGERRSGYRLVRLRVCL